MTTDQILSLIDRELSRLDELSVAGMLPEEETKKLESLVRSRKLLLEQPATKGEQISLSLSPEQIEKLVNG